MRFYVRNIGITALIALGGCTASQVQSPSYASLPQTGGTSRAGHSSTPIEHIVLLVQESRTYNDLFGTTKTGQMRVGKGKHARTITVKLKESDLDDRRPLNDRYASYRRAYRDGNMDGFSQIVDPANGKAENRAPYQYVNPAQIRPYLTLSSDYAVADRMFQTQGSGDFTAHQDLIRGGTEISDSASIIDGPNGAIWGCPGSVGETTNLITTKLKYLHGEGPPPCFKYKTLQTLLDAKAVSWKYYTPGSGTGLQWNAFRAIAAVEENQDEWDAHISSPETNIFGDIENGQLPAMSWVVPSGVNSDHPGYGADTGPAWVTSVVNAIGESSYWNSTAIIIVWDDWGGFYDPVSPPKLDNQGGPGFRVPMIVASPYTPQGEVSHTVYGFGSIVRFIEDTWALGRLGTTDETTKSIGNMFDFGQSPRTFTPIST